MFSTHKLIYLNDKSACRGPIPLYCNKAFNFQELIKPNMMEREIVQKLPCDESRATVAEKKLSISIFKQVYSTFSHFSAKLSAHLFIYASLLSLSLSLSHRIVKIKFKTILFPSHLSKTKCLYFMLYLLFLFTY